MPARRSAPKDWQCMECGRRMTLKAAERATSGTDGCPRCGGVDIDLVPVAIAKPVPATSWDEYTDTAEC